MRRFLTWLAYGAGAAFIFRWRLRRRKPERVPAADPADELKRKLEESRAAEAQLPPEPAPPQEGVDERRRSVHDRGRAAIDRMHGDPPSGS